MPRSKARTDDWLFLAEHCAGAREHLRAAYPIMLELQKLIVEDVKRTPGSTHAWLPNQLLMELFRHLRDSGVLLNRGLKERTKS